MSAHPDTIRATRRAGALDILRFLAAAFIVLYHFETEAPLPLADLFPVFGRGWLATDFFLMLSGYILGRTYGRSLDERSLGGKRFLLRRLTRIWPPHLIVLTGMAILILTGGLLGVRPTHPEHFTLGAFEVQAGLVQAWASPWDMGWNGPTWSLSALVVCYAVYPLVWRLSKPLAGSVGALAVGLGVFVVAAWLSRTFLHHSLVDLPFHLGVLRALPLFVLGVLMSRFAGAPGNRRVTGALVGGVSAICLVALQVPAQNEITALTSIIAIALIVIAADAVQLPGTHLTRAAGDLSFALFITHVPVGMVWFDALRALGFVIGWEAWITGCLIALVSAILFDRLDDRPVQRLVRDWLNRKMLLASEAKPKTA